MRLHQSVMLAALWQHQRSRHGFLQLRVPQGTGYLFMLSSNIICDDTYSNKLWCIVGQGMFALREINRMERDVLLPGVAAQRRSLDAHAHIPSRNGVFFFIARSPFHPFLSVCSLHPPARLPCGDPCGSPPSPFSSMKMKQCTVRVAPRHRPVCRRRAAPSLLSTSISHSHSRSHFLKLATVVPRRSSGPPPTSFCQHPTHLPVVLHCTH